MVMDIGTQVVARGRRDLFAAFERTKMGGVGRVSLDTNKKPNCETACTPHHQFIF